jgi:hypothetical protein
MTSTTNTIRIATTIRTIRRLFFRGTSPSIENVFVLKKLNLQYLPGLGLLGADAATVWAGLREHSVRHFRSEK